MKNISDIRLNRRTLLKGLGVIGLASISPCIFSMALDNGKPLPRVRLKLTDYQTFKSTCAMECLHCNLTAYVYQGELKKIEASKGFNVKCCLRGISRTKWVSHPLRVKTPLLRVGEKGEGKFNPISWDEALDLIELNIRNTIASHGNKGLLISTSSGNMDSIKNDMAKAFFDYLGGATQRAGSLCCSAVTAAMIPMLGLRYADMRDTICDSRYILCWGNNPAVTMQAYFKEYIKAQNRGARLIVIDPRFNETAAKADEWIPIVPGTDTALALGMIKIIIDERRYDADFLRQHTGAVYLVDTQQKQLRENPQDQESYLVYDILSRRLVRHDTPAIVAALTQAELPADATFTTVFELIRQQAAPWSPEKVTAETDVPQATLLRLAREYASNKPSMIVQNMSGAQRTEFGTYVAASQFYLALLTGNMGKAGGGVCDAGGARQMMKFNPPVPAAPKVEKIPPIPVSKTGEWIVNDRPHPINFWWIMTLGALTQLPNTNMVKKALKKVPFVVVADNLMSSTALYADLVLPVTTIFEDLSLMASVRSHYVQLMEKAVEPVGEAKADYWIFARLAERFGFGEVFNQPIEHYIENCLAGTGITIEQLRQGPVKPVPVPWIPFKDGIFRTPTKKAHLFIEAWQKKDFPPIVTYMQVKESPKGSPELARKYPLMAVQRKLARSIHSSHGMNEWILEVQRNQPNIMIHPDDAASRNIQNGAWAIAFNHRGEHRALAVVTRQIKRGVVCLDNGWWEQQGGSSSHVTNDHVEVLGTGHCCNSTLVDVRAEA
ncbi:MULTISPECIES: molybdopterin-containing oxidoreductase family protein [Serratia]|uniref:Dimethyl sulfoxide reductase DmsA n=1 Tax=Serratia quinivorans TaxID=137545 RepID=A0A380AP55_9GAMM|nr:MULTISPECIES: molybdopterin-dependent oxidoreductase [Serratia]QBX64911.1 DMSO reductase [Serratia quinivorans]RYM59778.1 DMSO reductase [Serratia proteamaculans]CAI1587981.1 Dimethyl sulfoxide reductase DmsA precursor [Serratia quinivorans]SUI84868.1 Dimethyl sulfoxide reductase DmsA precursor [Serratia quinivorans]